MRPEKFQISMCTHAVWSESLNGAFSIAKAVKFHNADNVDSYQNARMHRLSRRWVHMSEGMWKTR